MTGILNILMVKIGVRISQFEQNVNFYYYNLLSSLLFLSFIIFYYFHDNKCSATAVLVLRILYHAMLTDKK